MMTYEPLHQFLDEHDISYYDLHQSALPHASIYMFKNDETVSLPTLNYLMYALGFHSLDQVIKYYRDGEETPPSNVRTLESVDKTFDRLFLTKKNTLVIPKEGIITPDSDQESDSKDKK